ncbi:CD63 antigen [Mizuhopecten yessoensis]|uniref:Tetraspanin n=2 Tax=Mizuhopecten yessoensis TaxID=6573 RepID=A0A210QP91_MIZYE|nr:CD63 antigen [Mizuhopecten yessoensis]
MNTKSTKELLKNIKETAKEKRKFRVTKSLALLSSILVVMAGIGVLCLGILNMMDGEAQMYVAVTKKGPKDNSFQYYCYGLCFIGASVLLVCLCGCIGALKINTCLLKMFIVTLVLLLTLNGVMVTMVVVSQKDLPSIPLLAAVVDGVKDVVLDHMKTNLRDSYKAGSLVARAWDQLQVQMECCGCQSQNDYKYSAWWNVTSDSKTNMPDSCCIVAVKDIDDLKPTNKFLCQSMTPGFWHNTGCHDVLMVWYKQNSVMAFGATMGLVALEILSLICTVRLYRSLTQKTATSASNI